MTSEDPVEPRLPSATMRPRRHWSFLWLLPLIALGVASWLLYSAYSQRGIAITVTFHQGHGLKAGDTLRYRGITLGTVEKVRLAEDLNRIYVDIRLRPDARDLARTGSRFWIVRPQLTLNRVAGLDTVIGANYLSVLPGKGPYQNQFIGLEEQPWLEVMEPGGLEIVLTTPNKGNLRQGAPVTYRQVAVGTILEVDLAKDASSVEARVYIKPDYVSLIREDTKFWKTGGARFSAGLTGLSLDVDSVSSLILGGVTLALPPDAGKRVPEGRRFSLHEEPKQAWLEWTPSLPLFHTNSNTAQKQPHSLTATLSWQYKNLFRLTRETSRKAWVLPIKGGLLGPADVLTPPHQALPGSVQLTLDHTTISLARARSYPNGLAYLPLEHDYPPWTHLRFTHQPEDTLIIAGPAMPVRYIGANRYQAQQSLWIVDPALPFDEDWHGACVVAETDGALVGILRVREDDAAEVMSVTESIITEVHGGRLKVQPGNRAELHRTAADEVPVVKGFQKAAYPD